MKRIILALVVFVVCGFGAQAQFFVGGSLGFNTSGGSEKINGTTTDKPKYTYFNLSPKAGMFLSDKFAVGAKLTFDFQSKETSAATITTTKKTTGFGITPFARYYFLQMNKFGIFAEGQMELYFSKSKEKVGSTTNDGPKTTAFGINIAPVMYYNLTDKISLEASISLFKLGYNTTVEKLDDDKEVTNNFGFGVGLDGLVNTGNISIGAIYKF